MAYFIIAVMTVLPLAVSAALYCTYRVEIHWLYIGTLIYYPVAYHALDLAFRRFGTGFCPIGWPDLWNRPTVSHVVSNGDHGSSTGSTDRPSPTVRSDDSPPSADDTGERTEYDIKVDFNTLAEMAQKLGVCEFSLYLAHYRTTGEVRSLSKSRKTHWCGRCLGCAIYDRTGKAGAKT
jgi:hypothetical protein